MPNHLSLFVPSILEIRSALQDWTFGRVSKFVSVTLKCSEILHRRGSIATLMEIRISVILYRRALERSSFGERLRSYCSGTAQVEKADRRTCFCCGEKGDSRKLKRINPSWNAVRTTPLRRDNFRNSSGDYLRRTGRVDWKTTIRERSESVGLKSLQPY